MNVQVQAERMSGRTITMSGDLRPLELKAVHRWL
jgi:hypothetical protein